MIGHVGQQPQNDLLTIHGLKYVEFVDFYSIPKVALSQCRSNACVIKKRGNYLFFHIKILENWSNKLEVTQKVSNYIHP